MIMPNFCRYLKSLLKPIDALQAIWGEVNIISNVTQCIYILLLWQMCTMGVKSYTCIRTRKVDVDRAHVKHIKTYLLGLELTIVITTNAWI